MVLFYVDDILIWSQLKGEAERIFDMLAKKYKLKCTGLMEEGCEGEVTFSGRKITVMFGLVLTCGRVVRSLKLLKLPTLEKISEGDQSAPLARFTTVTGES